MPAGDFRLSIKGMTMGFLMDVEVHQGEIGDASALAPTTTAALRRNWTLPAGATSLSAVCRYEGGILLSRSIPAGVTTCAATLVSPERDGGGWWYAATATITCR